MKKEDLKTGMYVKITDEWYEGFIVFKGLDICGTSKAVLYVYKNENIGWDNLQSAPSEDNWLSVYNPSSTVAISELIKTGYVTTPQWNCIWENKPSTPEYTMEEAINKMGHNFKIKK